MRELKDKVAVITGAASGIGAEIASLFAAHGARVVIADLQLEAGERIADGIEGGAARAIRCDVSRASDVQEAVRYACDQYGGIDIMCNNAGVAALDTLIHATDEAVIDRTLAVNYKGVWLGIKYAAAAMIQQNRGGSILTVASAMGAMPRIGYTAYGSSKAAAIHATRIAALELAEHNIRVNVINPGAILTAMVHQNAATPMTDEQLSARMARIQPLHRAGRPADIAQAALYLSSDAASFVTGQVLTVDGGGVIPAEGVSTEAMMARLAND